MNTEVLAGTRSEPHRPQRDHEAPAEEDQSQIERGELTTSSNGRLGQRERRVGKQGEVTVVVDQGSQHENRDPRIDESLERLDGRPALGLVDQGRRDEKRDGDKTDRHENSGAEEGAPP